MSLDGFTAGPDQDADDPLGVGGGLLHEWIFLTRSGMKMIGETGGSRGRDNELVEAGFDGIGATIMGRNMFGPIRGSWDQSDWRGWWGDNPPFHHPVFVMTHHSRESFSMDGETTFHFVTGGPEEALARATEAAGDADIRLGGGASAIQQFLERGLVDHMHVAVVPVMLGGGERLFENGVGAPGYQCSMEVGDAEVTHFFLDRQAGRLTPFGG